MDINGYEWLILAAPYPSLLLLVFFHFVLFARRNAFGSFGCRHHLGRRRVRVREALEEAVHDEGAKDQIHQQNRHNGAVHPSAIAVWPAQVPLPPLIRGMNKRYIPWVSETKVQKELDGQRTEWTDRVNYSELTDS